MFRLIQIVGPTRVSILTANALTPQLSKLGSSLCAVFLPSLTPVRTLRVSGISPSALFIPVRILPNFVGASSTIIMHDCQCHDTLEQNDGERGRTRTSSTRLENEVNRTSTVHIRIIEPIAPASQFFCKYFGGADEQRRLGACELDAEVFLRGVTPDERPFFSGAFRMSVRYGMCR